MVKPWWLFLPPERVGTPRSDVRIAINAIENSKGESTSVPMLPCIKNKEGDIENGDSPDDESKKKNDLICVHNRGELVLFSCAILLDCVEVPCVRGGLCAAGRTEWLIWNFVRSMYLENII